MSRVTLTCWKMWCIILYFSVVNHAVQEPKAIAKAPEGEGCPRCGGYVYAAEQMLARGRVSTLTIAMFYYIYIYNWGFLLSLVRLDTCVFLIIRSYYTMQHNWVDVVIFFTKVMKVWQVMTSNDSISAVNSILDSFAFTVYWCFWQAASLLWNEGWIAETWDTQRKAVLMKDRK